MDYENGSIPYLLKLTAKEAFITLIKKINGRKDLILSERLIGILDLICGLIILKANGIEKIYKLESVSSGQAKSQNQCFVIKPTLSETKRVANYIKELIQTNPELNFWIIFVPRCLSVCDLCLEQEGVYNHVRILEYPLGLIPLDDDLFSLEIDNFFTNCVLNQDQTDISHIVNSLNQFQQLVGRMCNIYAKGNVSKKVFRAYSNEKSQIQFTKESVMKNMILIDRDCDYTSVLLSPLNYQGLLDETFPIKNGKIEFGSEITKAENKTKHNMNSFDPVFRNICDMPFHSVFSVLKEKGQKVKTAYDKTKELNLSDMKDFVAKELKILQTQKNSLSLHISACEVIMEQKKQSKFADQMRIEQNIIEGIDYKESQNFLEENIIQQTSPSILLRLMSLYSHTQDGLNASTYKNLLTLFLQSFGHEHIITLFNLKKLGLFTEYNQNVNLTVQSPNNSLNSSGFAKVTSVISSNKKFRSLVKRLNLIPQITDSYDVRNPPDSGYVFGGTYIPVVCRLVEILALKSMSDDLIKYIPGDYASSNRNEQTLTSLSQQANQTLLVYFIGGVTYAEISALRFLAKQKNIKILIATTNVINGNNFMKNLMPQL